MKYFQLIIMSTLYLSGNLSNADTQEFTQLNAEERTQTLVKIEERCRRNHPLEGGVTCCVYRNGVLQYCYDAN